MAKGRTPVASAIDEACRDVGFFCIAEHGASLDVLSSLDEAARRFFALPEAESGDRHGPGRSGVAGLVPVGRRGDVGPAGRQEGLYFGEELDVTDARVRAGRPCTDRTSSRKACQTFGAPVLAWMDEMTALAHVVMRGVAMGLGLPAAWFEDELTREPTVLFRIFRYRRASGCEQLGRGRAHGLDC